MSESAKPTGLIVGSIICSVIALVFLPPIFGAGALVFGYHIYKRNAAVGKVYLTIGALAMLVGTGVLVIYTIQNANTLQRY